jgi:beta-glucosidase
MLYQTFFKHLLKGTLALLISLPALALPRDFKFCVSTAAHQVEGHNENSDWWLWENAPGKIKNGDTSLVATDSWNHLDEDIANMKWMGIDTYRFSVEWAKIEPREGEFDEAMIQRYVEQIEALKRAGIEPMVTLYHFTFPLWVSQKGGWDWDGLPKAFERFTEKVVSQIGPRVKIWVTLNEPMTIIAAAYVSNVFPPAKNNISTMQTPMVNMVRAHALSYHAIHRVLDSDTFKPVVGLAHHLRNFDAFHRLNPLDRYAAKKFDQIFNWAIPDALTNGTLHLRLPFLLKTNVFIPEAIGTQDFFGLNFYSRDRIAVQLFKKELLARKTTPGAEVQDLGWEIYPEGMARLLDQIQLRFPNMPIWITENGIADHTDEKRSTYIRSHLDVISQAIAKGAPIQGYCHWTLNDNFEWAEGYTAKFGLFSLEPNTLRRLPRSSAYDFKEIISHTRSGLVP